MRAVRLSLIPLVLVLAAGIPVACGGDSTDTSTPAVTTTTTSTASSTTTAPPAKLKILVTNDDGYSADGIDAVVEGLRALPDVTVTVVAPLKNQSGTGGKSTPGTLTATDVTTKSGYAAKAIDGYPADTITWAIAQHGIDFTPDLVVSGINAGQNIGPIVDVSGTVGAARAAGAQNLPAVAVSQGGPTFDFPKGVAAVLEWLSANRGDLAAGKMVNINVPSCPAGTSLLGTVDVPIATDAKGEDLVGPQRCVAGATPTDDVNGFVQGYTTVSPLTAAA